MWLEPNSSSIDFAISHNREDLKLAESLLLRLDAAGLVGWIDSCSFYTPLVPAERQIERAFHKARFLCLLVGDRYRDSAWCQEEYNLGIRSEAGLSITRVLVVVESSTADSLIPVALKHAPRFDCSSNNEIQRVCDLIASGKNSVSQVADWSSREMRGDSSLVSRLPKEERIKLVGDHLEYLLLHFSNGTIDPRNHQSALRLGITAGLPSTHVCHASPASAIEMCWKSISEIIGDSLSRFLEEDWQVEDVAFLHISDIRTMFERVLPIYRDYLVIAAHRRGNPPEISEAELVAIIDYVICGFLAVICKANQCRDDLIDGVRELLRLVATYGDRRCADVANYLNAGLPTIGLSQFSSSRWIHIYKLLRHAK